MVAANGVIVNTSRTFDHVFCARTYVLWLCPNTKEVIRWKAFTSLTLWSCQIQKH